MPQHGAPNGKRASQQILIYPTFSWTNFKNEYGTGTLTAAYNIARYGGAQASKVGSNIGVATAINDYDSPSNSFDELLYTYQLGGSWDWLTIGLGQFPMYNFDGSAYNSNQQVNFINYALSQNASSTYSTAGVGTYVQIAPNSDWTFVLGAQDATNVDGISVRINNLDEEHYTTFGSISYTPTIKGLGAGQYSILLYNMPSVKEQQGTTNGWSLNLSQDFGDKLSLFARINGVSGNVATINQSWVLGGVYNNPLDRNPLDQIGLAFAYNKIDEKAVGSKLDHDAEKVIEAYWAWGISKWMTLTPDIQFYIDPAENPKSDYATVVSLRATFFSDEKSRLRPAFPLHADISPPGGFGHGQRCHLKIVVFDAGFQRSKRRTGIHLTDTLLKAGVYDFPNLIIVSIFSVLYGRIPSLLKLISIPSRLL